MDLAVQQKIQNSIWASDFALIIALTEIIVIFCVLLPSNTSGSWLHWMGHP